MTKSQDPMSPVTNYSKLLKGSLVRATNEKNTQTEDMQGNLRYGMIWFQSFQAQWQKESRTIIYGEFCSILYKRLTCKILAVKYFD